MKARRRWRRFEKEQLEAVPGYLLHYRNGRKRNRLTRLIFNHGRKAGWELVTSLYCGEEANRNIHKVAGSAFWLAEMRPNLRLHATELVLDYPLVFETTKDRPVVVSALGSHADYLLTLDRNDFATLLGTEVYGMRIRLPLSFAREVGLRPPAA